MSNLEQYNHVENQVAADMPKIVQIMQLSDPGAESLGLSAHGLAKFPGTVHIVQPKKQDNRWITGFDQHAAILNRYPAEEKTQKQAEARRLQEYFQNSLGISDLSATSAYWDSFYIDLASTTQLNLKNAKHAMFWCVLRANGYVMPDSTQKDKPEFWDNKFYAHQPEFEAQNRNSTLAVTDKAISSAYALKANFPRLLLITRLLLGRGITNTMGVEELYGKLRAYLDLNPLINCKAFNALEGRDINELAMEVVLDNAIIFNVIYFKANVYNRGTMVLGRTRDEVISYFKDPAMRGEFDSIEKEVKEKEALSKPNIV